MKKEKRACTRPLRAFIQNLGPGDDRWNGGRSSPAHSQTVARRRGAASMPPREDVLPGETPAHADIYTRIKTACPRR